VGPQRRDYALTESGFAALHEWAAVMRERTRLIAEFHELHRRDTCPLVGSVHPAHERGTGLH
jgi:DNA-binding PadR family transcriptional regulator